MKLARKRRLDFYVGLPLLIALDSLVALVGLVVRRRRRPGQLRRILVVKFQGLGSLAIAKPALHQLRRQHPTAHVAFWGVRETCALAAHMPEFDELICLDDRSLARAAWSLVGCLARIWRRRFDWVFDLEVYSKLSSVLTTFTLGRNRAGFAVALVRARRHLHTHLVVFNTYDYLGLAYLRLFGLVLAETDAGLLRQESGWRFPLDPLPGLPPRYVVLNPHVGALCPERKWPLASWVALARRLQAADSELRLVLLGWSGEECDENRSWPEGLDLSDLGGKLPLPELVRCLAHAQLVVSADSGPLQLALLTGAPVVGLFGPTRPRTYFPPDRPRSRSLSLELYCSPCLHHWDWPPCRGDNQCMRALAVEEVSLWCLALLGHPVDVVGFRRPELVDPGYYAGLIHA